MAAETSELSWSLARFSAAAYRCKGRAVIVFAAVILSAVAALFLLPKEYASEARLFVRIGRENVSLDPTITDKETIGLTATREVEINSILEHLRSRLLVEMVLETLNPGFADSPEVEKALEIRDLEGRIFVDAPKASTVVILHCEAENPREAQTTLDTFVDVYLGEHMRVNQSSGSREFFVEQADLLREQIDESRKKLRDAKSMAGMASLEGQRTSLETQVRNAQTRIGEVNAELSATRAAIDAMESSLERVPETMLAQFVEGTPNDGIATMRQTLFELQSEEQEILSKFTEDHPTLRAMRAKVKRVEEALKSATPTRAEIKQAVMIREITKAQSLSAEKLELESQLVGLGDRLKELNQSEGEIESLVSDLKRLELRYQVYVEHMEEARMEEALHADRITNISIIQPASYVPTPIRPRKASVLLLACVAGVLCSAGTVFLSDQRPTLVNPASPSSSADPADHSPRRFDDADHTLASGGHTVTTSRPR